MILSYIIIIIFIDIINYIAIILIKISTPAIYI